MKAQLQIKDINLCSKGDLQQVYASVSEIWWDII